MPKPMHRYDKDAVWKDELAKLRAELVAVRKEAEHNFRQAEAGYRAANENRLALAEAHTVLAELVDRLDRVTGGVRIDRAGVVALCQGLLTKHGVPAFEPKPKPDPSCCTCDNCKGRCAPGEPMCCTHYDKAEAKFLGRAR